MDDLPIDDETEYRDLIRDEILAEIKRRRVEPTPQAVKALVESAMVSSPEIVGDSDSMLAGLLLSGSYTVDILETAGVNPALLKTRTFELIDSNIRLTNREVDPVASLLSRSSTFESAIKLAQQESKILETSHILESAISPHSLDPIFYFPLELRADEPPSSPLLRELERCLCSTIADLTTRFMDYRLASEALTKRRHPITEREDWTLDKKLGREFRGLETDELEFIISAYNAWFVKRRVLIDPPEVCLRVVNRVGTPMLFGSQLIAETRGDLKAVNTGLQNARKYSPERDLPTMALFLRNGRIQMGQYSYRNSLFVDNSTSAGFPVSRVQLQAIQPVPIISREMLFGLERLISKEQIREGELQRYLSEHPELLMSLGYTSARPHICLRPDESSKLIPDYILELPGKRGFDILDLKLPTERITARHPYLRMSSELTKAVAQLRKYGQYFENATYRKEFERKYGLTAFKPELIVVMGRSNEFTSRDDRVEIEGQLGNIKLMTYDDVMEYGHSRTLNLPEGVILPRGRVY